MGAQGGLVVTWDIAYTRWVWVQTFLFLNPCFAHFGIARCDTGRGRKGGKKRGGMGDDAGLRSRRGRGVSE